MTEPWYVTQTNDAVYLMRKYLDAATAQSECDRLNGLAQEPQVVGEPVKVRTTVYAREGEPTVVVQKVKEAWAAVVNGKYYAPVDNEISALNIARDVVKKRSSADWGWCCMETNLNVDRALVDAEWKPAKEDIKTVEINQNEAGMWRVVLNGKFEARAGMGHQQAIEIHEATVDGRPFGWNWCLLDTTPMINLRDYITVEERTR